MRTLLLILLAAQALAFGGKRPAVTPTPEPVQSVTPAPTASPSGKVPSIVYDPIISLDSEKSFIKEGEKQANAILASECFKSEVKKRTFQENKGLTSDQIYKKFVDASPMKVGIKMFMGSYSENHFSKTVGYEGNPIKMNRYFVRTGTYVGSTSLHEGFGHGLGFTHYTPKMNPKSVPYQLNDIFEVCAKKLGFKVVY